MGFYATILAHRRLALMLFILLASHLLVIAAVCYVLVRYQQFWLIPAVFWLPLLILGIRFTSGSLKSIFTGRDDDVLAASGLGITAPAAGDPDRQVLTNVAEEIAVATGSPQPQAVLCNSPALNAFVSYAEGSRQQEMKIVFTSGASSSLDRYELQGVAAHLYAHRRNFEQMLVSMAGAMYFAVFAGADFFLFLNMLNWHYGGSGDFSTGPLVVILTLAVALSPVAAARLAQLWVMRRTRFLDDLRALEITNDPDSLIGALEKLAGSPGKLEAHYNLSNIHFYFDSVTDPSKRYPWEKLPTHPSPAARIRAVKKATGRAGSIRE